jgi:hypothetical protein
MKLHGQVMNLQTPDYSGLLAAPDYAAKIGHRDARHAAAELALRGDAAIDALRNLDARLRECMALGLTAAEAYDSHYQAETAEALAVGAA